jgi:acyl carrier protein
MIMTDVFGIDATDLPENVSYSELAEWDSLRHLELMLELEQEFDTEISSEAMPELLSLDAIEQYLRTEVAAS